MHFRTHKQTFLGQTLRTNKPHSTPSPIQSWDAAKLGGHSDACTRSRTSFDASTTSSQSFLPSCISNALFVRCNSFTSFIACDAFALFDKFPLYFFSALCCLLKEREREKQFHCVFIREAGALYLASNWRLPADIQPTYSRLPERPGSQQERMSFKK